MWRVFITHDGRVCFVNNEDKKNVYMLVSLTHRIITGNSLHDAIRNHLLEGLELIDFE